MMRNITVLTFFILALLGILYRLVTLQVFHNDFLQVQGDARSMRVVSMPTHRGMILDRNKEPLAISSPVDSLWLNPQLSPEQASNWPELCKLLKIPVAQISEKIRINSVKEFVYLQRHISPDLAEKIMALNIPGVYLQREYRRFYPEGEVTAHVLGFTDIDDHGQEGLELTFDNYLNGKNGKKRVLKDLHGREFQLIDIIKTPKPGQNIQLSIDKRLQYIAYRELKKTVKEQHANAGSIVILDVNSGEVLAMVNQPVFNPNVRVKHNAASYRNRAITDAFEPGSVIKPLSLGAMLQTKAVNTTTFVDTNPGWVKIDDQIVKDGRNLGLLNVEGVLRRSSNVGITKLLLRTHSQQDLLSFYRKLGFGASTDSGFPGESSGKITKPQEGQDFVYATLAFGYGIAVTPLQIAEAFATIGAQGVKHSVNFIKTTNEDTNQVKVFSKEVSNELLMMLERVVENGSGFRAQLKHYRVAGKTGTARKLTSKGYSNDHHVSVFAGIAPVSHPKLAMVVVIDDPQNGKYYGSQVAAPTFAKVMQGALSTLNIPPDKI